MAAANTLFALMATGNPTALKTVIMSKHKDMALEVAPGQWLIVLPSTTTTIELSLDLGITDGSNGGAIVLSVSSYYGRSSPSTWEWIAAKTGVTPNAVQAG
ncbi:MAG: hypothetical protein ACRD27_08715 [Terracidiphilus sp.]